MATEFLMPKLGLTMESGTILAWLVDDGVQVTAGTPVLAIETDKTETEVEAADAGRLHIVGAVGETFPCGAVIGWLLAEGESAPTAELAPPSAPAAVPGGRLLSSPNARRVARELGVDLTSVRGTGPGGRIVAADVEVAATTVAPVARSTEHAAPSGDPRRAGLVPATAAARNLADLLGIDIATVPVDERERRVTRESVALHVRGLLSSAVPAAPEPATEPLLQTPSSLVPLTGMRGTIARRMRESLSEMAQLSLFMDAELGAVDADRARRGDAAPGYTDYVVAAVARALVDHPIFNSQVVGDAVAVLPDVHVGVAVAVDGGLLVPVVRDTPSRTLDELAAESRRLVAAARSGSLRFDELEGGTCSVTSLGMFGVDGFTPVINPPNAAIVGVGRRRTDVVLDDNGNVTTAARVTLSLTWDHRVADGAPAAEFCRTITELLADPHALDTPR